MKEGARRLLLARRELGGEAKVPGVAWIQRAGGKLPIVGLDNVDPETLPRQWWDAMEPAACGSTFSTCTPTGVGVEVGVPEYPRPDPIEPWRIIALVVGLLALAAVLR